MLGIALSIPSFVCRDSAWAQVLGWSITWSTPAVCASKLRSKQAADHKLSCHPCRTGKVLMYQCQLVRNTEASWCPQDQISTQNSSLLIPSPNCLQQLLKMIHFKHRSHRLLGKSASNYRTEVDADIFRAEKERHSGAHSRVAQAWQPRMKSLPTCFTHAYLFELPHVSPTVGESP